MGSKKKQVIGIRYYMGMHMVICHSADYITEIQVGERTAWVGSANNTQIYIDNINLFGGDKKEGGVQGYVDVLMGGAGQFMNDYLQRFLGVSIPAFRGVVSLVLRRVQISANNPYAKPWAVRVVRNASMSDGESIAANPVRMIRECLTDRVWGMGYPNSSIDQDSFSYGESVLNCENFGLNLIWTRQQPIEDFIRIILDHILGVLYRNPETGQFAIRLIRDDYDPALVPIYNRNSVVSVESFERVGYGETANEVTVVYTNRGNWNARSITVHNLANIAVQGGIVTKKIEFPGICSRDLAARVAMRELKTASSPLAKIRMKVDRRSWISEPAGLFKLDWPELEVEGVVFRIITVDYGTIDDGTITIEGLEDVFSLGTEGTIGSNDDEFELPDNSPVQPYRAFAFELSYWDIGRVLSRADLAFTDETDTYVGAIAATDKDNQLEWDIAVGADIDSADAAATEAYAPTLSLVLPLTRTVADSISVSYVNGFNVDEIEIGDFAYLLNADGQNWSECVKVKAIDTALATISFARAVIDSLPVVHPAGTILIMADDYTNSEQIIRAPSEIVQVYTIPTTTSSVGEKYPVDNGAGVSGAEITLFGRQGRPYPPADFKIDNKYWPIAFMGDLNLTWKHRNRLLQTGFLVEQAEPSIALEPSVSYTVEITGEDNVTLIKTITGIITAGETYLGSDEIIDSGLPAARANNKLSIKLFSIRGSIESLQDHTATVDRADYGYNYGKYYGGI